MDLSVRVIGTVFIDCKGFARQKYHPEGRNLGDIEFVHGGVGRNVAENLVNFDLPVTLVSSVDDNALGVEVVDRLKEINLNTSLILKAEKNGMGMWLALINESGDLVGSISKMPDLTSLEEFINKNGEELVASSSHIVLELDLTSRITRKVVELSNKMNKPVYGIPGNLEVVMENLDILPMLECFICNDFEAGKIIGIDLTGLECGQVKWLLAKHFFVEGKRSRYTVVTLGSEGSIYHDAISDSVKYMPALPTEVIDTSGAGDAYFSGTVLGLIQGLPLEQAVACGTRVASWTISSLQSICPDLKDKVREEKFRLPGLNHPGD